MEAHTIWNLDSCNTPRVWNFDPNYEGIVTEFEFEGIGAKIQLRMTLEHVRSLREQYGQVLQDEQLTREGSWDEKLNHVIKETTK